MLPALAWHELPELPPSRPSKSVARPSGRLIVSEPTDRVMVRTASGDVKQALYHHATRQFWTIGEERDAPIPDVVAWAFEREPSDAA